jgi:hypothetical protein
MKKLYLFAILGLNAWTLLAGGVAAPVDDSVPPASSEKQNKADTKLGDEKGADRDGYDFGLPGATAMKGNPKNRGLVGSRSFNERQKTISHPPVANHPPVFSHSTPNAGNRVTARDLKPEKFSPAPTRPVSVGKPATPRLASQSRQMPAALGGPLFNNHNRGRNPGIIGGPLRYTARNLTGLNGSEIKPKP